MGGNFLKKQVFNPFLPLDEYVPDGEPHVFGDRVYIFGSHDKEGGETYCMLDYVAYSAPINDLSDWRFENVIYRSSQDPSYAYGQTFMYAPDVVKGNDGKYYLYYCTAGKDGYGSFMGTINVAVCDTPAGKYKFYGYVRHQDGSPMTRYVNFDPAVINDGGVIRLYYGTQRYFFGQSKEFELNWLTKNFGRTEEELASVPESVMGANTAVLDDDMLTVLEGPRHILATDSKGTDFEEHPFFEASSMRKIGDKYYFIYSSLKSHELCYAISDYPDRDFAYGGTIVSVGDVGLPGITDENPNNVCGNTHGSIEYINGQWYVFYHRHTHKSDYSRQACAEKIFFTSDGQISQVEVTSCGLNDKPLTDKGTYPAIIAANITNGHMPHMGDGISKEIFPCIINRGEDRFISEITEETQVVYKYFDFKDSSYLGVTLRSDAAGQIRVYNSVADLPLAVINYSKTNDWQEFKTYIQFKKGTHPLILVFEPSGNTEFLEFNLC